MKTLPLLYFTFLFVSINLHAQNLEDSLNLETPTGLIKGTLLIPDNSEKVPLVIMVSGSGPTDRDGNNPMMKNNSLKMIAHGLGVAGIATLRFDKRGVGASKDAGLSEIDLRFENYIDDVNSWVDLLKTDDRFSKLIIMGHSEGSLIGMIAARNEQVDGFISLAGVGRPAGEVIMEQLQAQPPMVLEQAIPVLEKLKQGVMVEKVPPFLYSIFRPSVQPYIISWFKYDPSVELGKLKKAILIIQGTTDIQVGIIDADLLATANKRSTKEILDGMNHVLKTAPIERDKNILTYSDPKLTLHKDLLRTLVSFISKL